MHSFFLLLLLLACVHTDDPAGKAEIALLNNRVLQLEAEVTSANTRADEAAQAAIMAAEAAREAAEAADLARFAEVWSLWWGFAWFTLNS